MAIELKSIENIINKNYKFVIPTYQRGFRWRTQNIVDLLNDIKEFLENLNQDNLDEIYCLQPLVIKKISEDSFEVIDGQQRLTTLLILLSQIYKNLNLENTLFSIEYTSRPKSKEFLYNLCTTQIVDNPNIKQNIDFYFMSQAYHTIEQWLTPNNHNFLKQKEKYFIARFQFIWYETSEENSYSIFQRLNAGKIALTDSELIKSLILINASDAREEIIRDWNEIEYKMMDDDFFSFFFIDSNNKNRIDLLIGLYLKEKFLPIKYSYFHKFKGISNKNYENKWKEIYEIFTYLNEIYSSREFYHCVGFLLNCHNKITLEDIIENFRVKNKDNFKTYLIDKIKERIGLLSELRNLSYGHKDVYNVLFLFNVITYQNEKKDLSLFPFRIYSSYSYDIEHIRPRKPKEEEYLPWLEIVQENLKDYSDKKYFNDVDEEKKSLYESISSVLEEGIINQLSDGEFSEIYNRIMNYYKITEIDENENDKISNLALLDSITNRGYKNSPYHIKKFLLFKSEKLILPCTSNAFLKVYSKDTMSHTINYWTMKDASDYEEKLYFAISTYLG